MDVTYVAVITVCTGIITLDKVIDIIGKYKAKLRQPSKTIEEEIAILKARQDAIDLKVAQHENYFTNDNKRIQHNEDGMKLVLKSCQVLVRHALEGDNVKPLEEFETELNDFIWK